MKGWIAGAIILAGASLAAQAGQPMPMGKTSITSEEDYSKVMKEVGQQNGALRKSLQSASEADAAAAASRLEALFKDTQAYWEDKKVEDAATAAKNAQMAAATISKALASHDMTAANAAMSTLGSQCMTCHTAHRERQPDGSFKMK